MEFHIQLVEQQVQQENVDINEEQHIGAVLRTTYRRRRIYKRETAAFLLVGIAAPIKKKDLQKK
jgi:hypothetical protein